MHFKKSAMMLSVLLIFVFVVAAGATPFTTTDLRTTCPTPSTVGAYVSNSVTCDTGTVDGWLNFSGFVDSPSANGMTMQALANSGFYFPENQSGPMNFEIGFNVHAFNTMADGVLFDLTASSPPQGHATVTMYECTGNAMDCLMNPGTTLTLGSSMAAQTIHFDPTATLGLMFVGNMDSVSTLTQFEASLLLGASGSTGANGNVPEPATLLLMACGLAGLGLTRRKFGPWRLPRGSCQN